MGAQKSTEGVQATEGIQTDASKDVEQTDPKQGDGVLLDLKQLYVYNGKEMLGADVINDMGRGKLASKLTSDLHKAQTQIEELQTVADENLALRAKLEEIERREQMEAFVKETMPASKAVSTPGQTANNWLTGEEEMPVAPPLDTKLIAQQIDTATQKAIGTQNLDIEAMIEKSVAAMFEKQNAEQKQQQTLNTYHKNTVSARVESLKSELGLDEATADRIVKLKDASMLRQMEAKALVGQGAIEAANEKWTESVAYEDAATDIHAKAIVAHQQEQRRLEIEQQLETGDFPALEKDKPTKRKRLWNKQEKKERQDADLAELKRTATAITAAQKAQGV